AVVPATIPVAIFSRLTPSPYSSVAGAPSVAWGAFSGFVVTSLFALPVAYAFMLVVGIPAALGALAIGRPYLVAALAVGGLSGAAASLRIKGGEVERLPMAGKDWEGVTVGAVCWLLVKRV